MRRRLLSRCTPRTERTQRRPYPFPRSPLGGVNAACADMPNRSQQLGLLILLAVLAALAVYRAL